MAVLILLEALLTIQDVFEALCQDFCWPRVLWPILTSSPNGARVATTPELVTDGAIGSRVRLLSLAPDTELLCIGCGVLGRYFAGRSELLRVSRLVLEYTEMILVAIEL